MKHSSLSEPWLFGLKNRMDMTRLRGFTILLLGWTTTGGSTYCVGVLMKCLLSVMFPAGCSLNFLLIATTPLDTLSPLTSLFCFVCLIFYLAYFSYFSGLFFRLVAPQRQKLPTVCFTQIEDLAWERILTPKIAADWICWENKHGDIVKLRARNPPWVSNHRGTWRRGQEITSWRLSKDTSCI